MKFFIQLKIISVIKCHRTSKDVKLQSHYAFDLQLKYKHNDTIKK